MNSDRGCLLLIRVPAGHTHCRRLLQTVWRVLLRGPPTWWQTELVCELVIGVQYFAKHVHRYNASGHPLMRIPAVHSSSWR